MKLFTQKKFMNTVMLSLMLSATQIMAKESNKDVLFNAERITTISQELAKNYFYIQQGIQVSSAKKILKEDMLALDEAIKKVKKNSKDEETKSIVDFMLFSVDELKSTIKETANEENGALLLDYTETLLEGSETIAKHNKGKTESMLDVVEEMEFLLERASKYYIAFRAGYTDAVNVTQGKLAVEKFERLLEKVKAYTFYSEAIVNGPVKKLSKYWPVSKNFYLGIKQNDLPTIVFISTKHMKTALEELITYHKKN